MGPFKKIDMRKRLLKFSGLLFQSHVAEPSVKVSRMS
jgi:hypothetical protein